MDRPSILIFGLGPLQASLIEQCRAQRLYTVGIDISSDAECKEAVDAFEVVAGDDFEKTLEVAKKYQVSGVITAATDKPLVMMARVAEEMKLPFFSVQTARWSTDKQQMKQRFMEYSVPCARGVEIKGPDEMDSIPWNYPVIVKPRDNSGSRGVIYCTNQEEAKKAIDEAFEYTKKNSVLVEEFIEGQEYSIESLHYNGISHIIQFTQKITTEFPYNVELGHIQPAELSERQKSEIKEIISNIASALQFQNCASHTELKINKNGITVIETSPRLGGDFITSMLTPLSTGINVEEILIKVSIGKEIEEKCFLPTQERSSGIVFFELPQGRVKSIGDLKKVSGIDGCKHFGLNLKVGDEIGQITCSLNRYGEAVFQTDTKCHTENAIEEAKKKIREVVTIQ